jgi:hypothetical protein
MGKMVVVEGDAVQGTDKHTVSGMTASPPPPVVYGGTGSYKYDGKMTGSLSTFVTIGGKPVALTTSQSSLNSPHVASAGTDLTPPTANPATLIFAPPVVGTGVPNAAAGSAFLTIGGTKVLLDGDKIDTCDGTGSANSTVTASGQSFVSCSA